MLNELTMLRNYYGAKDGAVFYSDLLRRHAPETIAAHAAAGDIEIRPIHIGPDAGRRLVVLA